MTRKDGMKTIHEVYADNGDPDPDPFFVAPSFSLTFLHPRLSLSKLLFTNTPL